MPGGDAAELLTGEGSGMEQKLRNLGLNNGNNNNNNSDGNGIGGLENPLAGADEETMKEATKMWEMLDNMAKNDPRAYKKFIAKQRKEQAKELKREKKQKEERLAMLPQFQFCVTTTRTDLSSSSCKYYVNFCQSKGVPACQKPDGSLAAKDEPTGNTVIPLSVGPLMPFTDKQKKKAKACDIVVHPSTIARASAEMQFKLFLIELGLQYMEEDFNERYHRAYKTLDPSEGYFGPSNSPAAQRTELGIQEAKRQAKLNALKESQEMRNNKEVVLPFTAKAQEITKKTEEFQSSLLGDDLKLSKQPTSSSSSSASKKPLIQVVSSSSSATTSSSSSSSAVIASKTPVFSSKVNAEAKTCEVVVQCPDVSSAAELEIDIDDTKLVIGGNVYHLTFAFPQQVDGDRAIAKFKKKKQVLKITAPLR